MSDTARHRATPQQGPRHRGTPASAAETHEQDQHKARRHTSAGLATGSILIVSALAGTAAPAAAPPPRQASSSAQQAPVTADPAAKLTPAKPEVKTVPKPKPKPAPPPAPAPKPAAAVPRAVTAPLPVIPRPAPRPAPAPAPAPKPAPAPAPRPAPPASKAAGIASAALGQLGMRQDCTRLVTNALSAVGISHHGWPVSYFALGTRVAAAQAVPGDLIYYQNGGLGLAHIAVYIGNGQAVHGGWNGNQTVVFSANVGSGPVYIRVA